MDPANNRARVISDSVEATPGVVADKRGNNINRVRPNAIARQRALRQAIEQETLTKEELGDLRLPGVKPPTKVNELAEGIKSAQKAVRITELTGPILSVYWFIYPFQFLATLFFLLAIGIGMLMANLSEDTWLSSAASLIFDLTPTGLLLGLGWVVAAGLGLGFMLFTALAVWGARVKNPWTWYSLIICAAAQAAPVLFILPWPAIWVGLVMYLETHKK